MTTIFYGLRNDVDYLVPHARFVRYLQEASRFIDYVLTELRTEQTLRLHNDCLFGTFESLDDVKKALPDYDFSNVERLIETFEPKYVEDGEQVEERVGQFFLEVVYRLATYGDQHSTELRLESTETKYRFVALEQDRLGQS